MIPGFLGTTLNGAVKKIYGTRKPLKIHGKSSCQNFDDGTPEIGQKPANAPDFDLSGYYFCFIRLTGCRSGIMV